jgi:hypothetical protein
VKPILVHKVNILQILHFILFCCSRLHGIYNKCVQTKMLGHLKQMALCEWHFASIHVNISLTILILVHSNLFLLVKLIYIYIYIYIWRMKWFWRFPISRNEKKTNKNCHLFICSFWCVAKIFKKLKNCISYMIYSKIWFNILRDDHHFFYIFMFMIATLHTKHNSLQYQQFIHVYHFLYKILILTLGHSTQPGSKHHEMQMEKVILSTIKLRW